jgi:hypothetical protein
LSKIDLKSFKGFSHLPDGQAGINADNIADLRRFRDTGFEVSAKICDSICANPREINNSLFKAKKYDYVTAT